MTSSEGAPGPQDTRRVRAWLLIVLGLGLLVRLAWGLSRPTDEASLAALPDQQGYVELARSLLGGEGLKFVDPRFGPEGAGQTVYAVRTPGYPLFLAACGGSLSVARVAQALLDTSTALAIFLLARRWLPPGAWVGAPVVAAALVAFNPFLVYFSGLLLTETLFTAMLAWGMALLSGSGSARLVAGAALLALSVLVRPSAAPLPALLATAAAWGRSRDAALRTRWRPSLAGGLVLLLVVAVLLPWAWRNSRVLGRWVWSTTNDGITSYDGFRPGADGSSDQSFLAHMPDVRRMGELERSDYFGAKARSHIRESPARVVQLAIAKIARTWSPVPLSRDFGTPLYIVVGLLFSVPFDLLMILGIVRGGLGSRSLIFLALPALYFTLVHALSVGSLRYRVPVEPPLAVVAAAGFASLPRKRIAHLS